MSVIPIWLRDIYAKVGSSPLSDVIGENIVSGVTENTESLAVSELGKLFPETTFFIRGNELYSYLARYLNASVCNDVITFVLVGLRDLYWNQRHKLTTEQLDQLELSMNQPLPQFYSIFNYQSLSDAGSEMATSAFQLFGTITPFSVVHVPVRDYINAVNNKQPISVFLPELDIILSLSYELSDFWDPLTNQLLTNVALSC